MLLLVVICLVCGETAIKETRSFGVWVKRFPVRRFREPGVLQFSAQSLRTVFAKNCRDLRRLSFTPCKMNKPRCRALRRIAETTNPHKKTHRTYQSLGSWNSLQPPGSRTRSVSLSRCSMPMRTRELRMQRRRPASPPPNKGGGGVNWGVLRLFWIPHFRKSREPEHPPVYYLQFRIIMNSVVII